MAPYPPRASSHRALKKPLDIVYGVDEIPPRGVILVSAFQHVMVMSIRLLFPVLVAREAGLAPARVLDVVSVSMPCARRELQQRDQMEDGPQRDHERGDRAQRERAQGRPRHPGAGPGYGAPLDMETTECTVAR